MESKENPIHSLPDVWPIIDPKSPCCQSDGVHLNVPDGGESVGAASVGLQRQGGQRGAQPGAATRHSWGVDS